MNLANRLKNRLKMRIEALPFINIRIEQLKSLYVQIGHYYSPIPSLEDLKRAKIHNSNKPEILGIDWNRDEQIGLIENSKKYYEELPWTTDNSEFRCTFENEMYSYSDGIFFYFILRNYQPQQIIEIGSGWTSGLILDTAECSNIRIDLQCIEPFPDRLRSVTRKGDHYNLTQDIVQNVPLSTFDRLNNQDILFIDSSHVTKAGGDVNYIFFEILPRLKNGVLIHVHDIHKNFEYPTTWMDQGRAWNEAYLLRALLSDSNRYRIILASDYIVNEHNSWLQQNMPLCLNNSGGSIWFQVNE